MKPVYISNKQDSFIKYTQLSVYQTLFVNQHMAPELTRTNIMLTVKGNFRKNPNNPNLLKLNIFSTSKTPKPEYIIRVQSLGKQRS